MGRGGRNEMLPFIILRGGHFQAHDVLHRGVYLVRRPGRRNSHVLVSPGDARGRESGQVHAGLEVKEAAFHLSARMRNQGRRAGWRRQGT